MNEIIIVLLMISVWACHRGFTDLFNYLLEKIVMIGFAATLVYRLGDLWVSLYL